MTHGPAHEQPEPSADLLLGAVLADLTGRVVAGRAAALADEPDAVHQLRTTVRRIRNLLAAFGDCFEPAPAAELAASLSSYGDLLGGCRDLEVRAADTATALAALGLEDLLTEAVIGPLRADHADALAALRTWHAGPGVVALDELLGRWSVTPPFSSGAGRAGERVATRAVRRQVRRVLSRADAAVGGSEEGRHDLRKAARRLRHTVDATDRAPLLGRLGQEIQGMLGDHRDAVLLADHVGQCGIGAADPAPYDLVVAHALDLADGALSGLDPALVDLRDLASS